MVSYYVPAFILVKVSAVKGTVEIMVYPEEDSRAGKQIIRTSADACIGAGESFLPTIEQAEHAEYQALPFQAIQVV